MDYKGKVLRFLSHLKYVLANKPDRSFERLILAIEPIQTIKTTKVHHTM